MAKDQVVSHQSVLAEKYKGKNYTVISTDCHAGANLLDYRPYLETKYHEKFDEWASTFEDPWGEISSRVEAQGADQVANFKYGVFSYDLAVNWDSHLRMKTLESQGVVAEIIFPNTSPPFCPSGTSALGHPGPLTREEYDLRLAGVQAHNRWLAEFCADAPGRRAGMAQVYLDDIDDTLAEIRLAHERGLKGILLPGDHVKKVIELYEKKYERVWALCAELGMPVGRHSFVSNMSGTEGSAAVWVGLQEQVFWDLRGLTHMVCSGVFERYPNLKFVTTESLGASAITAIVEQMDAIYASAFAKSERAVFTTMAVAEAASALTMKPSEYVARNCYVASPIDFKSTRAAGVPNVMFGIDLPHSEGMFPHTLEAMQILLSDLPEAEVRATTSLRAAECFGFDLDKLQVVADEVGYSPEQVATPPNWDAFPKYPEDTLCHVFVHGTEGDGFVNG
jgi:predicted TIM-barrel fold metal-dependent hydrolase